ncbi:MAG: patatin-like phospholipase family protein [Coprobacillus sp.]
MKRALVLAGGGSKGAYEVGFVTALKELGIDYQIVTGTSIGALNGCLLAQGDFDALVKLWEEMDITHIFAGDFDNSFAFDIDTMLNQSNLVVSFFKKYLKEKGANITPLINILNKLLDKDKLLSSPIDYGLCTVYYPSLKPLFITKLEMEPEYILDYLISSASCFPVFPIHSFKNSSFIDGGYYDNLPIDLAFDMGADEVIVVDMNQEGTHKHYIDRPHITYTRPYLDLGGFLDFSKDALERNKRIGYQTAMKTYGKLAGVKYTFEMFDTPLYSDFYKEVLYIERNMRSIFKSDSSGNIVNKFMESHKGRPLLENEYLYVGLDWLAELVDRDASYIYNFDLFCKDLMIDFSKYIDPQYQMISLKSSEDLTQSLKQMNKRGIVGRLLHEMIYPKEEKHEVDKFLSKFTKEVVMARLLYMIYKEIKTVKEQKHELQGYHQKHEQQRI